MTKLAITIDTEGDDCWRRPQNYPSITNLDYVPRFQSLCERFNFKATYLLTSEYATSARAKETLLSYRSRGTAEIGAHLHPWTTEPFWRSDWGPTRQYFPCELPLEIFEVKIKNLTKQIKENYGFQPIAYRAGRFGVSSDHFEILYDLGYRIDTSFVPSMAFGSDDQSLEIVQFHSQDIFPKFLEIKGEKRLLEIPVTVLYTHPLFRSKLFKTFYKRNEFNVIGRALRRTAVGKQPLWFRPFPEYKTRTLKAVAATAIRHGSPILNLMFHSNELMPDGSPYHRTNGSIEELFSKLENVFIALRDFGIEGTTLEDYYNEAVGRRNELSKFPRDS
jgi:hypothetical protein